VPIYLVFHDSHGIQAPPERIYGGTNEIMKTIIARDLTGLRA
jgi:alkylation response protein AidB-like acyl-CoA dehydrogenase